MGEDTAFLQQLCGRTLLGYCTILEHHDLVRAGDSAHPVGDNEDGLVLNKSGKCLLNGCFVLHVQTGSGFIQQNDRRILQEGAGNGNALPLAAGQLAAVFTDVGIPTVRELFGEFVHIGELCRRDHLFVRGLLSANADIFQNAVIKQRYILKHDGIEAHQLFRIDLRHIHAAHGDPAPINVPEPRRQTGNGSLTAAGWTDQRRDLPLLRYKGHVLQHRFAALVGKAHMLEHNVAVLIG